MAACSLAMVAEWAYHKLTGGQLIRWDDINNSPWEATITYIPTKTLKIASDAVTNHTALSTSSIRSDGGHGEAFGLLPFVLVFVLVVLGTLVVARKAILSAQEGRAQEPVACITAPETATTQGERNKELVTLLMRVEAIVEEVCDVRALLNEAAPAFRELLEERDQLREALAQKSRQVDEPEDLKNTGEKAEEVDGTQPEAQEATKPAPDENQHPEEQKQPEEEGEQSEGDAEAAQPEETEPQGKKKYRRRGGVKVNKKKRAAYAAQDLLLAQMAGMADMSENVFDAVDASSATAD